MTAQEREQAMIFIIIGAVEGGSGYWADFRKYEWQDDGPNGDYHSVSVEVRESNDEQGTEPGPWKLVTPLAIEAALLRIRDGEGSMANSYRARLIAAYYVADQDLDATDYDLAMQMAVLETVKYG